MSNTQTLASKIYITLDSLLDTRLGALVKINDKFAFNVTNNHDYYIRQTDEFADEEFGILTKEQFDKVSTLFKNDILHLSLKTKMYVFLKELCNTLIEKAISTPYIAGIEVEVNIYPYDLNTEECELLSKAVSIHLNNLFNVSIVSISLKDLTCKYIKDNYCGMIMYHYGEWMNLHQVQLQKREIKDVALYIPRIHYVRALTQEEEKEYNNNQNDIFETLSILLREFITMQFLPVSLYCADLPTNI